MSNEANNLTSEEYMQIAKTIRSQISPMAILRCNARDFVAGQENGEAFLLFRVTKANEPRSFYQVKIIYDYGQDLYNMQLIKCYRQSLTRKVEGSFEGVYCDMLSELLEDMCLLGEVKK
jgi:hypothetical protein